jgi:protein O-mannosyl-transferase
MAADCQTRRVLWVGVIVAVVMGQYLPALTCGFVGFDDNLYVTDNQYVLGGLTADGCKYSWTTFDGGNWHPLTWLSLQWDAQWSGLNPFGYHLTNVLLHALNCVLLFEFWRRITGAVSRSACVALLFAVHPLHVESVAWISERKDVLSTAGMLAALLVYEWYARSPSRGRMLAVAVPMTLGLLAKPMLVTLPLLMCCLDCWPLRRWGEVRNDPSLPVADRYPSQTWMALVMEKTPLWLLSLAFGVITIKAQNQGGAITGLVLLSPWQRLAAAVTGYGWYLQKTLWPVDLCAFYNHPLQGGNQTLSSLLTSWPFLGGAAALVIGSGMAFLRRRCEPWWIGWAWYLIALLPVIGILQVGLQAYADRYAYVPHLGLFMLLVWEGNRWLERLDPCGRVARGVMCLLLAGSSVLTWRQINTWRDVESLWRHAATIEPNSSFVHLSQIISLARERRFDEATHLAERMLTRHGRSVQPVYLLGWIHFEQSHWEKAKYYFDWTLREQPSHTNAQRHLQLTIQQLSATGKSVDKQSSPQAMSPEEKEMLRQGLAAARAGDFAAARVAFQQAVDLNPQSADSHNNLALALSQLEDHAAARTHLERACALNPENADFHYNLVRLLEVLDEPAGIEEHLREVVRIRPHDLEAKQHLERWQLRRKP